MKEVNKKASKPLYLSRFSVFSWKSYLKNLANKF